VFPELRKDPQTVKDVINEEEAQFLKTLTRGQKLMEKIISKLPAGATVFPGDIVWRLYDTYGFPTDLTQLICEESGLSIDQAAFDAAKHAAQLLSQKQTTLDQDHIMLDVHAIDELKSRLFAPTPDSAKYEYTYSDSEACYQSTAPVRARVTAIRRNKAFVERVEEGEDCGLLLDATSFYAEQGGQIYDEGFICGAGDESQFEFSVQNVQVRGGYVLHVGRVQFGAVQVGDEVTLQVDMGRRAEVMNNHTGTHVLNFALRKVIGEAEQRGSAVAPDRLRFDFTSKAGLKTEQVRQIEEICDKCIADGLTV